MSGPNAMIHDIRRAFKLQDKARFDNAILNIVEKMSNYQIMIENSRRVALDINKRYLEIEDVDSSTNKLTINPCDGRVTLKVSLKASLNVKRNLTHLAQNLMDASVPPVTLRGKIIYKDGGYQTTLWSESKKQKYSIRVEEIIYE